MIIFKDVGNTKLEECNRHHYQSNINQGYYYLLVLTPCIINSQFPLSNHGYHYPLHLVLSYIYFRIRNASKYPHLHGALIESCN